MKSLNPPPLHHISLNPSNSHSSLHQLMHVPLVFFYSAEPGGDVGQANAAITSQRFMKALSEILIHLYPFLGRIDGNIFVDCNDEGVPYTEAHVHCPLSDTLKNPDANLMRMFLPIHVESKDSGKNSQYVQASFFECGGMAIGICVSHKLTDAATLGRFINEWAKIASGNGNIKPVHKPDFTLSSLLPPSDFLSSLTLNLTPQNYVTKRFVFTPSSIATLKAKSAKNFCLHGWNPYRLSFGSA